MMIKGTALKVVPEAIKEKFSEEGLNKWMTKIPDYVEKEYEQGIITSKWYPLNDFYLSPVKMYCELFYSGSLRGAYELGRYDAEKAVKGIFKFLYKLNTPDFFIVDASLIFPNYYKDSEMEVICKKNGYTTARI